MLLYEMVEQTDKSPIRRNQQQKLSINNVKGSAWLLLRSSPPMMLRNAYQTVQNQKTACVKHTSVEVIEKKSGGKKQKLCKQQHYATRRLLYIKCLTKIQFMTFQKVSLCSHECRCLWEHITVCLFPNLKCDSDLILYVEKHTQESHGSPNKSSPFITEK